MLPSLYVNHMEQENLDSIVNVQRGYIKNRSYDGLTIKNPTGSATIEIPLNGHTIYLAGKTFRFKIKIEDPQFLEILDKMRTSFSDFKDSGKLEMSDIDWDIFKKKILADDQMKANQLFSIDLTTKNPSKDLKTTKMKNHRISDNLYVMEGGINDGDNQYSTYIAFSKTKDTVIFSFLPVMTPQMTEISSIIVQSLPMIIAVVLFLVLVASQIFSKNIINPIIRLAGYAEDVKMAGDSEMEPFPVKDHDEIGDLGRTLNELYERLRQQYQELEEKNLKLSGENKRQEVFLRASSHQLKTPVTAALLLVEGMMDQIGKYKDTKTYLPEVKKQLLSMQKIIEDILYLNHCAEHIQKEEISPKDLLLEVIQNHRIPAEAKGLQFRIQGQCDSLVTDREILKKIIENLVSNAVSYTPSGQSIEIQLDTKGIDLFNHGAKIEEDLIPHIFEPFVSSNTKQKGRGLGLYIASYYAELLGFTLEIKNVKEGVLARLILSSCIPSSSKLHTQLL